MTIVQMNNLCLRISRKFVIQKGYNAEHTLPECLQKIIGIKALQLQLASRQCLLSLRNQEALKKLANPCVLVHGNDSRDI